MLRHRWMPEVWSEGWSFACLHLTQPASPRWTRSRAPGNRSALASRPSSSCPRGTSSTPGCRPPRPGPRLVVPRGHLRPTGRRSERSSVDGLPVRRPHVRRGGHARRGHRTRSLIAASNGTNVAAMLAARVPHLGSVLCSSIQPSRSGQTPRPRTTMTMRSGSSGRRTRLGSGGALPTGGRTGPGSLAGSWRRPSTSRIRRRSSRRCFGSRSMPTLRCSSSSTVNGTPVATS